MFSRGESFHFGAADIHRDIVARQAIPRGLVPDDLAGTVRFLVSDGSAAMTGQVLEVGAGLVLR